jgi:hypothetical protein
VLRNPTQLQGATPLCQPTSRKVARFGPVRAVLLPLTHGARGVIVTLGTPSGCLMGILSFGAASFVWVALLMWMISVALAFSEER